MPGLVAVADEGERGYLAAMLGGWGFKTVTATSSAEALARLRPDLHAALIDRALLAAGLDGWRAVRAAEPLPPLIFVSASADDTDVDRFGREEAAAVLAPPFPLRAVHHAIASVTRECV